MPKGHLAMRRRRRTMTTQLALNLSQRCVVYFTMRVLCNMFCSLHPTTNIETLHFARRRQERGLHHSPALHLPKHPPRLTPHLIVADLLFFRVQMQDLPYLQSRFPFLDHVQVHPRPSLPVLKMDKTAQKGTKMPR